MPAIRQKRRVTGTVNTPKSPEARSALKLSRPFAGKRWQAGLATIGLAAALLAGASFWRASQALRIAARQAAAKSQAPFTDARLDRQLPSGIDWIQSPALFSDAVQFHGHIFLSGPEGLYEFDSNLRPVAQYRVGLDLPPYQLASLAKGYLPSSNLRSLFIATEGGGLLTFDGKSFRQILPGRADCRDVTSVLPLSNRRLILGTSKAGVLIYDGKSLSEFHSRLSNLPVSALAGDDTDLWVGTRDRGVMHWHAGQVDEFSEAQGLPDPQVLSLAGAGDAAFVGTPLGVAEFVNGRLNRVLAKGYIARSLMVSGDTLEVGTVDEGTLEIPLRAGSTSSARPAIRDLDSEVLRFLDIDSNTLALTKNGLYRLNSTAGGWEQVIGQGKSLLTDSNIAALAFDPSNRLWVGYFDRGLDVLASDGSRLTHVEDEHVFCVNRIVYDTEHNQALVATANGLALFDAAGRERQVLGRADGLISNHVTDVVLEKNGIAVATPAGITLVDSSGARSLYAFQGLVSNHVYTLAASGGRLLAGTLGGLSILEDGQVMANFTTSNSGLKRNWITAIVPVGNDDWFVGTYGAGILRFDSSGHWQTFEGATGPFEVNPNALLAEGRRVYAGTRGHGLMVYERERERWTRVADGLPSMNVTALAVHGDSVYVGTDNGMVRISKEFLASQ
jgi:ligand-binding sensor domain-containing protein